MVNGAAWTDDYLLRVNVAKMVNRVHEGPVLAAWEVDGLDEMWIYALNAVADLPRRARPKQALEKKFAEFRRNHPTYRKTH